MSSRRAAIDQTIDTLRVRTDGVRHQARRSAYVLLSGFAALLVWQLVRRVSRRKRVVPRASRRLLAVSSR